MVDRRFQARREAIDCTLEREGERLMAGVDKGRSWSLSGPQRERRFVNRAFCALFLRRTLRPVVALRPASSADAQRRCRKVIVVGEVE